MRRQRGIIDPLEVAFIDSLLEGGDPHLKKTALQRLCKHFRTGLALRDTSRLNHLARSHLYDGDPKVIRWSLNALAFFDLDTDLPAIVEAIDRNRENPDILGAGVAALAARMPEDDLREALHHRGLPLEGATLLAAAQKVPSLRKEVGAQRVDIDRASIPELRLAGVLVGIGQAPENMFSSAHINAMVIGQLNGHPDRIVAQYSIWALAENSALGLRELRIPLADVGAQYDNIRGYIYQLVAEDAEAAAANLDFLEQGSRDPCAEARLLLARGLRDARFEELDSFVLGWALKEDSPRVSAALLEHMAVQARHVPSYREFVVDTYRREGERSMGRLRLEAAARGTELGAELQKIRYAVETHDLFTIGGNVTNNQFNGPINSGAFSASGNATSGDVRFDQRQSTADAAELLRELAAILNRSDVPEVRAKAGEASSAADAPKKSLVQSLLDWVKLASEGGQLAGSLATQLPNLTSKLYLLLPHLPI